MKSKIIFLAKGLASVAVLKLLLLVIVFSVQACKKSADSNDETLKAARAEYKKSLALHAPTVKTLYKKHEKAYLSAIEMDKKKHINIRMERPPEGGEDPTPIYEIPYIEVPPAEEAELQPLLESSKTLLDSYGLTEAMVQEFDNDPNDPRLIEAALVVYSVEEQRAREGAPIAISSFMLGVQPTYARALTECLMVAVGLADLGVLLRVGIRQAMIDLGIAGVTRIVGSFLVKHVGYWGALVSLYEFGECMNS